MYEIQNDAFYDFIRPYDSDAQYHFAGEVDYHLLKSDKPYEGLQSHRGAQELDADEFLDVELLPMEQLIRDIMDGKVPDGKTQVAVLKAARMLGR